MNASAENGENLYDVNDMYACTTSSEFIAWFDVVSNDELVGNYPAKSEALMIAVRLLRQAEGERMMNIAANLEYWTRHSFQLALVGAALGLFFGFVVGAIFGDWAAHDAHGITHEEPVP